TVEPVENTSSDPSPAVEPSAHVEPDPVNPGPNTAPDLDELRAAWDREVPDEPAHGDQAPADDGELSPEALEAMTAELDRQLSLPALRQTFADLQKQHAAMNLQHQVQRDRLQFAEAELEIRAQIPGVEFSSEQLKEAAAGLWSMNAK